MRKRNIELKKEGYLEGGTYYCSHCQKAHHYLSAIGRMHIRFANISSQKFALLKFGIFKRD